MLRAVYFLQQRHETTDKSGNALINVDRETIGGDEHLRHNKTHDDFRVKPSRNTFKS